MVELNDAQLWADTTYYENQFWTEAFYQSSLLVRVLYGLALACVVEPGSVHVTAVSMDRPTGKTSPGLVTIRIAQNGKVDAETTKLVEGLVAWIGEARSISSQEPTDEQVGRSLASWGGYVFGAIGVLDLGLVGCGFYSSGIFREPKTTWYIPGNPTIADRVGASVVRWNVG